MADLKGQAKQHYVAVMFARIATRYDLMNDLMTVGLHRRWKKRTASLTTQGLQGAALDVCTGTGDLAMALARCPGMDQVVGVDLLPGMISLARSKARAKGLDGGTNLVLGDALMLPFPSNTFACATSGFSLRNMPDLQEALAEMVRVVRPGGRVTTLELTPMDNSVSSMMKRWFFHRFVPHPGTLVCQWRSVPLWAGLIGQVVARDRAAYTYLPQSVDYFPGAERLEGLLTELGLINVGYTKLGMGSVTLHWGDVPSA